MTSAVDPTFGAFTEAFVDVHGSRVHYLHAGSGKPMLLIHGLVGSSRNWQDNISALSENASVFAIDLLNVGKSDRIPGIDAGLEATADRVAATIEALGLDRADIAGHSHGGAVALMLAARHPDLVSSLILFAPANPYSTSSDLMVRLYSSRLGGLLAKWAPYVPHAIQRIALGRMYGDPARISETCLAGYIEDLRQPGAVEHIMQIVRCWFADMARLKTALPLVANVPTLLVWGDRDRAMSVKSGVRLQQMITTSELVIIPGGGHVVFEELSEKTNRVAIGWQKRNLGSSNHPASNSNDSPLHRLDSSGASSLAVHTAQPASMGQLSPDS